MTAPMRIDRRAGLVLAGSLLLVFIALALSVLLPAADPTLAEPSTAHPQHSAAADRGSEVFQSEGCWYCHTQQVRDVPVDATYGQPRAAGDYHEDSPAMLGTERMGPDLTHVGAKLDQAAIAKALASRSHRGFGYLTDKQTDDLVAYLLSRS